MSSRRYVKRIWRVPQDRGALEYFGTLVLKALIKHGWPAKLEVDPVTYGVVIQSHDTGGDLPPDFEEAFAIACRIVARTYRLQITQYSNWCGLDREYEVTRGGHFSEVKNR